VSVKTPDSQGKFWDSMSEQTQPVAEALRLVESLFSVTDIQGRDVLDAGCGAGDFTLALQSLGARHVTAFDFSAGRMHELARSNPSGSYAQASLSELPYTAESFDLIWAWGVLHYVPDTRNALKEIARTLRPGGCAIIHTLRKGFWSSLELGSRNVLSRTPQRLQPLALNAGERVIPLMSRLMTGRSAAQQTSKTIRQKLLERLFVPTTLTTFSLPDLASGLGDWLEVQEVHPPVPDLFKRDMSITVIARKRA